MDVLRGWVRGVSRRTRPGGAGCASRGRSGWAVPYVGVAVPAAAWLGFPIVGQNRRGDGSTVDMIYVDPGKDLPITLWAASHKDEAAAR